MYLHEVGKIIQHGPEMDLLLCLQPEWKLVMCCVYEK